MNENCLKHVDFFTGFREKAAIEKFNNFIKDSTNRDLSKLKNLEPKKLGIVDYLFLVIVNMIVILYLCYYFIFSKYHAVFTSVILGWSAVIFSRALLKMSFRDLLYGC